MRAPFVYMIRRKSDGLFSSGGMSPHFTTVGKMWRNLNTFHNHLALFRERYLPWKVSEYHNYDRGPYENGVWCLPEVYKDCEVVKCRVEVLEYMDLHDYLKTERPPTDELRELKK